MPPESTDQSPMLALQSAAVLLFVLIHLFAGRIAVLNRLPRSRWLSAAGGVSVAYVFVHVFPELAEAQEKVQTEIAVYSWIEHHAYLLALFGLATFYGLERLAKTKLTAAAEGSEPAREAPGVFWLHIGSFALYNALVGYLLVHREDETLKGFAFYAAAMAVHFLVNDYGLRQHHKRDYARVGRWALTLAVVAGWALGQATRIGEAATGSLFAFLAGGMTLNVLKEELPEERASRFAPFALAATAYAALLLLL